MNSTKFKVLGIYIIVAYIISAFVHFTKTRALISTAAKPQSMITEHSVAREVHCPNLHKTPAESPIMGIPLVFVLTESGNEENKQRFRVVVEQATRILGHASVYVVDTRGWYSSLVRVAGTTVLDTSTFSDEDILCSFHPSSINLRSFKALVTNPSLSLWFHLGYFANFYRPRTFVYVNSETLLLANPVQFLPVTKNCSVSSIYAVSDHIAILQRSLLDCIMQSMIEQSSKQDDDSHNLHATQLLDTCRRKSTNKHDQCQLNLSVPFTLSFARDHHLRSSQGMAMWRESNSSSSEFKRLLIQRGVATAEDAPSQRPVQLATIHLQGQSKRFHGFLSHALRRTAADHYATVGFGPGHPPPTNDVDPPDPAEDGSVELGGGGDGAGEVPLVFSPVSPCTPPRRAHLLDAVRYACRAVGAGNVFVIDEGRCAAGAVPAGATVLPVESLLAGRCGDAAREFNRSYVHLSSNRVALEKMSMIRWLYMRCLAESRGWRALMHAEGDVLLLAHPMHFPPPGPADCGAAPRAAGSGAGPPPADAGFNPAVSVVSGRSGHSAVLQAPLLACIADEIHGAYTDPERTAAWKRIYREGYLAKGKPGGICDMTFLDICAARLRAAAAEAGSAQCVVTSQDPWNQELLFDPGPESSRPGQSLVQPGAAGRGELALEVRRGMVLGRRAGAAAIRLLSLQMGRAPALVYELMVAALQRTRAEPELAIPVDAVGTSDGWNGG